METETYLFECQCGDVFEVNAKSREGAVDALQHMMNQSAISTHFQKKHPGEEVPNVEDMHETIEENLMQVAAL